MNKISCLPVSLFDKIITGEYSLADWANIAENAGLDAFDISSMFLREHTPVYISKVCEELDRAVLPPFMMTTYPDFTNPCSLERERQLDYLVFDVAMASALGFRYVRVTAGQNHSNINFAQTVDYVLDCFKRASKRADDYGVKLVFENHAKPSAWDVVDFSFNPIAFYAIAANLDDTGVRINFDTANATACGEDVCEMYKKVADKVETIHINDTQTIGFLTSCALGEGLVDFEKFFSTVKECGYDGWFSIEEASNRGVVGIKKAVDFLRGFLV